MDIATILASLDKLLARNLGSQFEADVFAALFHRADVIRSIEFANIDGALDTSIPVVDSTSRPKSFADRFWDLEQRVNADPKRDQLLLPFDVKSRLSQRAEDQIYITSLLQRQHVAFYVGICAANPDFVEVIHNIFGGRVKCRLLLTIGDVGRHSWVGMACRVR